MSNKILTIVLCILSSGYSFAKNYRESIDLSGEWNFRLDKNNVGNREKWFDQTFEDVVVLPGITDENQKGDKNDAVETELLTRKYIYIGKAWYQREVDIPEDWQEKAIKLFLERTKATEVWVDGKHFPQKKSLISPHIYDLTETLSPGKHTLTISVDNTFDLFPVGGSHALAKHTQTNWNGIIGEIKLEATDKIYINSLKLYPDVKNHEVKVVLLIKNPNGENIEGEIYCKVKGLNGNDHKVGKQTFQFSSNENEIVVTETYKMGDDFATWDEFNPNLYTLSVILQAKSSNHSFRDNVEETFGMVEFKTQGTQFIVNGRVTMLRGKHDACVFPLTGYPPMNKEAWIRHMSISKTYGINHFRFHSWTPPKAAFEAADMLGIYIQTELPNWKSFNKKDTIHYNFQKAEGENILDSYGNHPSFVMFALGNELGGDRNVFTQLVDSFRKYDHSILFAHGSNNYFWDPGIQPNEDFFVSARTKKMEDNFVNDIRASFSFADCPNGGLINGQFPNTTRNFESGLKNCNVPAIGHETGQYQMLPNFDEVTKYTGVLEARNFEVFKQRMIEENMFPYWKELFEASSKHSAMCYKDDNEISMRTPGFGGFQILDLQDFPGQGTALVGMLDAFMDSKGIITPEEWRQSCAAQTIQAKMPRLVWQNSEAFKAELIAINYGESDMVNRSISWTLTDQSGKKFSEGKTNALTFKQGKITSAGDINVSLSKINEPEKLILELSTQESEITNQYNIWVYPVINEVNKASDIEIVTVLDKPTLEKLQQGKKVLLIPSAKSIVKNSTGGLFTSDYWCYPMFKRISEDNNKPVSPGTLGLLINDQHPVFNDFPTSYHSDWQWWSLMKKSRPIVLDSTDASYRPIVQAIDNFERCSKLGLMFEFAVGEGKLFVCSTDLSDKSDYVAQTLLKSILAYMNSDQFEPVQKLTEKRLLSVIYGSKSYLSTATYNKTDFRNWALTPPMGWNSWDCYGPTVEEHEVKANADYMAEKLKAYGWEYIVVDIRWFVENDKAGGYNQTDPRYVIDEYGRYMPAVNRFSSAKDGQGFKELANYIHKKGLKFGIHIMRGIPKVAVEKKLPIKGTHGITADQVYSTELQCKWLRDNYTIVADRPGAQEYYNSIFKLYADWGIDFIKIDDLSRPYHKEEIELIRKAIDNCGRPIVLSTSPGATPIEFAEHVSKNANMWRLVDDVWDTWPHITHLMDVCEQWYPYTAPGTWPDCDMLPLGRISIRGERGKDRMTRLTKDEQYTLMSLWTIFRSPLMFGGDMPSNDDFTLSLLTNNEVLDILKYSTNNRLILSENNKKIWVADDTKSDDIFAAFFYAADQQSIDESLAIYNSEMITYRPQEQSTEIKVNIKGSKNLYLVVSDGGDNFTWDHADWIEPKLTGPKGTVLLTDMNWVNASAGWGNVQVNKTVGGNPLTVNGKEYNNGIGTHSNSIIEYSLPEGYDTFTAIAGLDKECVEHPEGATVKFHVFTQNPFGPELQDSLKIDLNFEKLGLKGKYMIRDLWIKKDLGEFSDETSLYVRNHGARLVRIRKVE